MTLILSHTTAFLFWRNYTGDIATLRRPARADAMGWRDVPDDSAPDLLAAWGIPCTPQRPVHLLFAGRDIRSQRTWVRAHVCSHLPAGALVRLSDDLLVVSPEYCLLQLSSRMSVPRAALAGCELCGTYALEGEDGTLRRRQPLTSRHAIAELLSTLPDYSGASLRRALPHILDAAASPMEAKLALLLSLPPRHGGYGLPAPRLNAAVGLGPAARALCDADELHPDLFWPEHLLGVEYDGRDSHDGAAARQSDTARLAALGAEGIEVRTLSWEQVADVDELDGAVQGIARCLGHRIRMRDAGFPAKRAALRAELGLPQERIAL